MESLRQGRFVVVGAGGVGSEAFGGGVPCGFNPILKGGGPKSQEGLEASLKPTYATCMTDALQAAIETAMREVSKVAAIDDPVERYTTARNVRADIKKIDQLLQQLQRHAAQELKPGHTWAEVGKALDVTGSRAEQIAKGR